jgi:hypothetical protein
MFLPHVYISNIPARTNTNTSLTGIGSNAGPTEIFQLQDDDGLGKKPNKRKYMKRKGKVVSQEPGEGNVAVVL